MKPQVEKWWKPSVAASEGVEPAPNARPLDEALDELEKHDAQAAQLVKLRYFGGLGHQEAARVLGLGRRAADRLWALARAWLYRRMAES
ncbi:MAG TPA: ECF-type sigma factor [Gemmataceae bacterium]|nr:ECF-type sigma factor [Gemmataceae bacterium]